MYCTRCGLERWSVNTAADSGACRCGNSLRPAPFQRPSPGNVDTFGGPPAAPS
jgi:hypothetical protein